MLAAAREPTDAVRVVGDLLRRGERIPGLGEFSYSDVKQPDVRPGADPRAKVLLDLVRKAAHRLHRPGSDAGTGQAPGTGQPPGTGQAPGGGPDPHAPDRPRAARRRAPHVKACPRRE
jgi:hypothetical protein